MPTIQIPTYPPIVPVRRQWGLTLIGALLHGQNQPFKSFWVWLIVINMGVSIINHAAVPALFFVLLRLYYAQINASLIFAGLLPVAVNSLHDIVQCSINFQNLPREYLHFKKFSIVTMENYPL